MDLKRELEDVATEGRSLFQECRDVFIAEMASQTISGLDCQELIDELESKVQDGFRHLTDERAASKMAVLESLFDLWERKYEEIQIIAEDDLSQKRYLQVWFTLS